MLISFLFLDFIFLSKIEFSSPSGLIHIDGNTLVYIAVIKHL